MREKCLGPNHPGVATALVILAVTNANRQGCGEMTEKQCGTNHPMSLLEKGSKLRKKLFANVRSWKQKRLVMAKWCEGLFA